MEGRDGEGMWRVEGGRIGSGKAGLWPREGGVCHQPLGDRPEVSPSPTLAQGALRVCSELPQRFH